MTNTFRCSECGRVFDNCGHCPECGAPAPFTPDEGMYPDAPLRDEYDEYDDEEEEECEDEEIEDAEIEELCEDIEAADEEFDEDLEEDAEDDR